MSTSQSTQASIIWQDTDFASINIAIKRNHDEFYYWPSAQQIERKYI